MTETSIIPVLAKEVEARAVTQPQTCPCGGQYIVVAREREGRPGHHYRSVMHSNPPCPEYKDNDMNRFLSLVHRFHQDNGDAPPPPPPRANRRARRAHVAVSRKKQKPKNKKRR